MLLQGDNSQVDTVVVGSAAYLFANVPAGVTVQVIVDQVQSNLGAPLADGSYQLFSFPTSAKHFVTIKQIAGPSGQLFLAKITITGTPPFAYASPGMGVSYLTSDPRVAFAVLPEVGYDQLSVVNSVMSGYPTMSRSHYTDTSFTFSASLNVLYAWVFLDGQRFRLTVDGVDKVAQVTVPATHLWGWAQLFSGLDQTQSHTYRLSTTQLGVTTTNGLRYSMVYSLRAAGGTGIDLTSRVAYRPTMVGVGTSITTNQRGSAGSYAGYLSLLAGSRGEQPVNMGVDAATVLAWSGTPSTNGSDAIENIGLKLASLSPAPGVLILEGGTNDMVSGATLQQFQDAYVRTLRGILVDPNMAGTKIFARALLPRWNKATGALSSIGSWNQQIQAAIAIVGSGQVVYVDDSTWLIPPTGITAVGDYVDGIHPSVQGQTKIAQNLNTILLTYGL